MKKKKTFKHKKLIIATLLGFILSTSYVGQQNPIVAEASVSTQTISPKPQHAKFTPSTTEYTKEDITLTIDFDKHSNKKMYKLAFTDNWIDYKEPITISENTIVFTKTVNLLG